MHAAVSGLLVVWITGELPPVLAAEGCVWRARTAGLWHWPVHHVPAALAGQHKACRKVPPSRAAPMCIRSMHAQVAIMQEQSWRSLRSALMRTHACCR
jgi:hypothetical protein